MDFARSQATGADQMSWEAGDLARLVLSRGEFGDDRAMGYDGQVCELIIYVGTVKQGPYTTHDAWEVVFFDGYEAYAAESVLKPLDDGNEKGSWDQISEIWVPSKSTAELSAVQSEVVTDEQTLLETLDEGLGALRDSIDDLRRLRDEPGDGSFGI